MKSRLRNDAWPGKGRAGHQSSSSVGGDYVERGDALGVQPRNASWHAGERELVGRSSSMSVTGCMVRGKRIERRERKRKYRNLKMVMVVASSVKARRDKVMREMPARRWHRPTRPAWRVAFGAPKPRASSGRLCNRHRGNGVTTWYVKKRPDQPGGGRRADGKRARRRHHICPKLAGEAQAERWWRRGDSSMVLPLPYALNSEIASTAAGACGTSILPGRRRSGVIFGAWRRLTPLCISCLLASSGVLP